MSSIADVGKAENQLVVQQVTALQQALRTASDREAILSTQLRHSRDEVSALNARVDSLTNERQEMLLEIDLVADCLGVAPHQYLPDVADELLATRNRLGEEVQLLRREINQKDMERIDERTELAIKHRIDLECARTQGIMLSLVIAFLMGAIAYLVGRWAK